MTQRVVEVPSRSERRDVLDQAWASFFSACGLEMIAVPNRHKDPAGYVRDLGVSALVFTGGGNLSPSVGTFHGRSPGIPLGLSDVAPDRDSTEASLLRAAMEETWPVIGVCRGMQVLNVFHGGRIEPVEGHSGTRHTIEVAGGRQDHPFRFEAEVNSYHDFGIPPEGVGQTLEVLAESDGWAEAVMSDRYPHLGIMWHPERNRSFSAADIALFSDFLRGTSR